MNFEHHVAGLLDLLQHGFGRQALILRPRDEQRYRRGLPITPVAAIGSPIHRLREIAEAVHEEALPVRRVLVRVVARGPGPASSKQKPSLVHVDWR